MKRLTETERQNIEGISSTLRKAKPREAQSDKEKGMTQETGGDEGGGGGLGSETGLNLTAYIIPLTLLIMLFFGEYIGFHSTMREEGCSTQNLQTPL